MLLVFTNDTLRRRLGGIEVTQFPSEKDFKNYKRLLIYLYMCSESNNVTFFLPQAMRRNTYYKLVGGRFSEEVASSLRR